MEYCGTIGCMRVPDRHWDETNAYGADGPRAGCDHPARSDGLAERLMRLLAGHPSADMRADPDWRDWIPDDPADLSPEDFIAEDLVHEDEDADGLPPDDLETGAGGSPGGDLAGGIGTRRAADMSRDGLGRDVSTGYRPWFAADGAGDPWFAEPTG
jgi:hypothetical protein